MAPNLHRLRVEFSTPDEFRREYNINLANGGIFVETALEFAASQPVVVELMLQYSGERVELEGEVVNCIAPPLAGPGATPGVAVQLSTPASQLRSILEPLLGTGNADAVAGGGAGRRAAARSEARAPVTLHWGSRPPIVGRTRNISSTGMLLSVAGEVVPLGSNVKLDLTHPKTGEDMRIDGTVVRHVEAVDGRLMALGIKFRAAPESQTELVDFVGKVKASEHSKRLGGISGPIAELGIHSLLHMFATYSPQGTLILTRDGEEGSLLFDGGLVRGARLGDLMDAHALAELLSWTRGSFQFIASADGNSFGALDLPIDEAIHEALTRGRSAPADAAPKIAPDAKLCILGSVDASALDKTEQAIVDLARVAMTVSKVLEVIPEPEAQIHQALEGLLERGVILLLD